MSERIQIKRTKGWRKPEGAIVVSRPSQWGNEYRVLRHSDGGWMVRGNGTTVCGADAPMTKEEAAEIAVEYFARRIPDGSHRAYLARVMLAGHDLACWCPVGQPCHGDVLLAIANSEGPGTRRVSATEETR